MSPLRPWAMHLAAVLTLATPVWAQAGPWTKDLGETYVKLSSDTYLPYRFEDPVRGLIDDRYLGQQFTAYGEVGLTPGHPIQLTLSVPVSIGVVRFERDQSGVTINGAATTTRMGDIRIGLQTALVPLKVAPVAVGVELKVPGYRNDSIGQNQAAWQGVFPRPGDGQLDLTVWLLGGAGFANGKGWIEGWLGYRWRSSIYVGWDIDADFVDGIPLRVTAGGKIGKTLLMGQVDGWFNVRPDEITREALGVGPAVLVDVWKGLALEGRLAVEPWAKRGSAGFSVGAGVSWRTL